MTTRERLAVVAVGVGVLAAPTVASPALATPTDTTGRVSVGSYGLQAGSGSGSGLQAVSADGRFVAFVSEAWTLDHDPAGETQVFVHDVLTSMTELVSPASDGTPSMSADGRYVAFTSLADNLVEGDTNDRHDVFVHDRLTGSTERVSLTSDGDEANGASFAPSLSAGGRHVAFVSYADDLVEDDTNDTRDVFVRDLDAGTTVRVSVASGGRQANRFSVEPSLSADGLRVAFASYADDLVERDTNDAWDIYVHHLVDRRTVRVSIAADGGQANGHSRRPFLSANGKVVAYESEATNLVAGPTNRDDVFVHDVVAGTTHRVPVASDGTPAIGASYGPSLSADGRHVAFTSMAESLVPGDTNGVPDVFVHDRVAGSTVRVSVAADGAQVTGSSGGASISADGRVVAFGSGARDLVPGDANIAWDVFVRGPWPPRPLPTIDVLGGPGALPDDVLARLHGLTDVIPQRLAGPDRYGTAATVVAYAFPTTVETVYVATGAAFPDALAASAAASGAPVLLVSPSKVPKWVANQLHRLAPTTIKVVGGPSAVSDEVLDRLYEVTRVVPQRLAGPNRYATAAGIVADAFPNAVRTVYVASGANFPDALAGSAAAAAHGAPMLLVAPTDVPPAVAVEIERLQPATIKVLGGPAAISEGVLRQLQGLTGVVPHRLAGATRYETAAAIVADAFPDPVDNVFVATGADFPDALVGSAAAMVGHAPVLLVAPDSVPDPAARQLARLLNH